MKILVVSDSHGDYNSLYKLVRMQSNAEIVLFLGDGSEEYDLVRQSFPEKMFYGVRGNNDWYCQLPMTQEITLEGKKIIMAHGHTFGVKYGLEKYAQYARDRGADIALFGHTHVPFERYEDGLYLLNPGALHRSIGSYGVVEIQNGEVLTNTTDFHVS